MEKEEIFTKYYVSVEILELKSEKFYKCLTAMKWMIL